MVKLTDEMKQDLQRRKIFPFATASKGGEPNVIPYRNANCRKMEKQSGLQTIIS